MELPDLPKIIWEPLKNSGLMVICIGREHTRDELKKFQEENDFTLDFAPDPTRDIFKLFATKNIPRNVLIGKDGTIPVHPALDTVEGLDETREGYFQSGNRIPVAGGGSGLIRHPFREGLHAGNAEHRPVLKRRGFRARRRDSEPIIYGRVLVFSNCISHKEGIP